ncbi:hypothetical protein PIB30_066180 [Stylosanthes scabra]|uniref:Uncharacterized protein n=1 Tax=Stylosanthes scabra TaxID=79078 RepID=A0ABU6ZKY4_9FABA|nr:hypothetical protein [Stylosanthes scabra]
MSEKEVNHKRKEQSKSIDVGCYGNYKPLKRGKVSHDAEMPGIGGKDGRVDTANDVTKNFGVQVAQLGNKSGHVTTDVNTPFDARMQMGHSSADGTSYRIGGNPNQFLNPYHGMMPMYPQFYSNLRGIGSSQFSHLGVNGSQDRNKME